jgi:hypothetical protein
MGLEGRDLGWGFGGGPAEHFIRNKSGAKHNDLTVSGTSAILSYGETTIALFELQRDTDCHSSYSCCFLPDSGQRVRVYRQIYSSMKLTPEHA